MKHPAFANNPREEVKAFLPALQLALRQMHAQQKRLQALQEPTTVYQREMFEQAAFLRARSLVRLSSIYLCAVVQNFFWQAPQALALILRELPPGIFDEQQLVRDLGLVFVPLPDLSAEHGAPASVHTMASIDAAINASCGRLLVITPIR